MQHSAADDDRLLHLLLALEDEHGQLGLEPRMRAGASPSKRSFHRWAELEKKKKTMARLDEVDTVSFIISGTIFRLRGEEVQLVTEPRARLIAKPHPGTLSVLNSRSACYSPTGTDDGMSADQYSDHSLGARLPMAERSRGWEVLKKPLNF
ncbi:conserved hypothetical protein [Coccidioides posadasii str. Silveira]|uniref:Uncharacterized protein n=1 Tax=Coccidioides posadasii (strain RMSCC 757 / Silveira) TaxID=443226 RepID=E9DD22_COCPS|nr:conserved hypothetical protein [Coccidioides posadasii str. Silveira]